MLYMELFFAVAHWIQISPYLPWMTSSHTRLLSFEEAQVRHGYHYYWVSDAMAAVGADADEVVEAAVARDSFL